MFSIMLTLSPKKHARLRQGLPAGIPKRPVWEVELESEKSTIGYELELVNSWWTSRKKKHNGNIMEYIGDLSIYI